MKKVAILLALFCMLTVTASAAYIPEDVISENRDGRQLITKTYMLPPDADPSGLVEEPFEVEGYSYHHLETVKEEQTFEDSKIQTEVVTLETDVDDLAAILEQLDASMEYNKDGYEAASEFISQVAGNLDELLEKASGKKGALNTLERLEQKRDRSMEELQKLMKQIAQAGPGQLPELEKQAVKAANQAQSQVNQTEAVGRMVRDQMLQNKEAVSGCIAQAVRAAAQKAESVSSALLAWGYGPDSNDPERRAADLELAARVGKSPTLMEVARYLGRLKELMDGKRKNGYAYGRGEKYSLELGGDINRAIASEFAMLAAPETLPLFLRKLQRKALKQYQRREPICKGSGDIICMLDESSSAESQAPWCKAVALALLDIAMRDQRRFAVIHFAGVGDVQTDLFLPGQYDREDVLRCAETFLNGNTDYETPLREALRLMEQEGFENADMVFVTDGECVLPDSFLEKLKAEQSVRGFQITGILLDQEDTGFEFSLREFCTNVYRTSQLSRDQIAEQLVVSRVA